jgi:hypothetical protein
MLFYSFSLLVLICADTFSIHKHANTFSIHKHEFSGLNLRIYGLAMPYPIIDWVELTPYSKLKKRYRKDSIFDWINSISIRSHKICQNCKNLVGLQFRLGLTHQSDKVSTAQHVKNLQWPKNSHSHPQLANCLAKPSIVEFPCVREDNAPNYYLMNKV